MSCSIWWLMSHRVKNHFTAECPQERGEEKPLRSPRPLLFDQNQPSTVAFCCEQRGTFQIPLEPLEPSSSSELCTNSPKEIPGHLCECSALTLPACIYLFPVFSECYFKSCFPLQCGLDQMLPHVLHHWEVLIAGSGVDPQQVTGRPSQAAQSQVCPALSCIPAIAGADVGGPASCSHQRNLKIHIKFTINLCKITKTNECFLSFARSRR